VPVDVTATQREGDITMKDSQVNDLRAAVFLTGAFLSHGLGSTLLGALAIVSIITSWLQCRLGR
jgi:hypothetical protein